MNSWAFHLAARAGTMLIQHLKLQVLARMVNFFVLFYGVVLLELTSSESITFAFPSYCCDIDLQWFLKKKPGQEDLPFWHDLVYELAAFILQWAMKLVRLILSWNMPAYFGYSCIKIGILWIILNLNFNGETIISISPLKKEAIFFLYYKGHKS